MPGKEIIVSAKLLLFGAGGLAFVAGPILFSAGLFCEPLASCGDWISAVNAWLKTFLILFFHPFSLA
ncbi:MAG TPA: hypothetical protein VK206_18035 [Anaerolineales bacterium]|nr:hypothetical protein [Anaerolineales bacterium]